MNDIEIGLGYRGDKPMRAYAPLAARAEELGFDLVSVFGDLLFQPPLGPLLEMAQATSRVRLGAACWNPYMTHPVEIAGQLAVLDDRSAGRSFLGLARGSWLGSLGIPQDAPLGRLREALAVIGELVAGGETGFRGRYYTLPPATRLHYPVPKAMPPVLIGTWGSATGAMAGELADEVKLGGTTNPGMAEQMLGWIAAGAARAGRDPDKVRLVTGAVTVVDEDGDRARERARAEAAMYLAIVAEFDPTIELPPGLLADVKARLDAGDPQGAGNLIPDELLRLFSFFGTPEQVVAQAQALLDVGVRRIEFGPPHGLTDEKGLEILGTEVLPHLRKGRSLNG